MTKRSNPWMMSGTFALAFLIALPAVAQGRRDGGSPEQRIERQMEHLTQKLSLTDEQQAPVKKILVESGEKMRDAFEGNGGDRAAMRETMQRLERQTESKLANVLDERQLERYRELVEERRSRMRSQKGGGRPPR